MSSRRSRSVRRLPSTFYELASEVALIGVSLAAVYTFERLFVDSSYFAPLAAAVICAHLLVAAVRWAGSGLIVATLLYVVGMFITLSVLFPPTTVETDALFSSEIPAGFVADLRLAGEQFQAVGTPADVTAPFLLLIAIVMWVVAYLSDWAAFRLRAPVEALIPPAAVFIFGAFFAAEQSRITTTVILVAASLLFVLLHRLSETATAGAWLGAGSAQRGQAALFRIGIGLMAATMVGGVMVAQLLPGYEEPPIFDPEDWDSNEAPRVVLSPLVDIRAGLVDQPDVEVFTVNSSRKDYWRITSLDVFDGRIWRSRGSFEKAATELDRTLPDGTAFEAVTQSFTITGLGQIWLPAAYEPAEILGVPDDVTLEYESDSGTLIVDRARENSDGLSYVLLSAVPNRDVAAIAGAGDSVPGDIAERYLELPDDFSERVRDQAEQIVASADAQTPYEKALALQNFFRDPTLFRYDLEVARGHSADRIEEFVFDIRAGYCEQFAGSYAAMARAVGLPARVAVGFTPGEYDPTIDAYRVNGKHAHAWPEVWIEDIGWLRFEPTPGRGAPGDDVYTGQPEDQEGSAPLPTSPSTTAAPAVNPNLPGPDATTIPQGQAGSTTTTTRVPQSDRAESGILGEDQAVSAGLIARWVAGLLAVVLLALTPLAYGIWRARKQQREVADDPRRRIGLAWSTALSALQFMGVETSDSQTPTEVVDQLAESDPDAAETLRPLSLDIVRATYGGDAAVPSARADAAETATATLAKRARDRRGAAEWWWQHASPINVWRDKVGTWGHLR